MKVLATLAVLGFLGLAPASAQWSSAEITQRRQNPVAVHVGGYALFVGGVPTPFTTSTSSRVDIYDSAASHPSDPNAWSTANLPVTKAGFAATVVGPYALFGGGYTTGGPSSFIFTASVDFYDSRLGPPSDPTAWGSFVLSQARILLSATTVGDKALFAGGLGNFGSGPSARVDIYDWTLGAPDDPAAWSSGDYLSVPRANIAAASVGSEALFAGGSANSATLNTVDIYDDVMDSWSTATLIDARITAAVTVGNRIYFGGGLGDTSTNTMSDAVDIYVAPANGQPGAWFADQLSVPRGDLAATALGDHVIFAGGATDGGVPSNIVDVHHPRRAGWTMELSEARSGLAGLTIGNRALFAGGMNRLRESTRTVDVLELRPRLRNVPAAPPVVVTLDARASVTGSRVWSLLVLQPVGR